jgi:GDP-fucose protein O-fucosyltransferase
MIPLKPASASLTHNSPSTSLEKGTYRMRTQRTSSSQQRFTYKVPPSDRRPEYSRTTPNMTILVFFLTFACLSSFGLAYYLFVTRWETSAPIQPPFADQHIKVIATESSKSVTFDPDERFLAYLPHSGFHNQRIAFENALVLAHFLNRTLLVPPIRLGYRPLRYVNFDSLSQFLLLSYKDGLRHCSQVLPDLPLPLECVDYFAYTHLSWEWLVNLTEVKAHQRLLHRWNMSDAWISEHLMIHDADVLFIKDSTPYQYRFLDTVTDAPPNQKYIENIFLPDLAFSKHRLIQVGTLFGSSRLLLRNMTNISIRGNIRRSMSYTNPTLVGVAQSISKSIGPAYVGVHLRLGDGRFQVHGEANTRLIWWRIVHQVLGYTASETLDLEWLFRDPAALNSRSKLSVPYIAADWNDTNSGLYRNQAPRTLQCRIGPYPQPHLLRLNTPIFISTDVEDPAVHPLLQRFHRTFPCIFYLSDFADDVAVLERLKNADDGIMLSNFLLPFVDAMVAAHASTFAGTEKSTFSRFIEDVLWRTYHNKDIVQRG